MLITLVSVAIALGSVALMVGGLRMVAQDTAELVRDAVSEARAAGDLGPRAAFLSLWAMIFVLSYF